jgi:hypothetical protein
MLWPKSVPAVEFVDELAMDVERTSSDTMWKFCIRWFEACLGTRPHCVLNRGQWPDRFTELLQIGLINKKRTKTVYLHY